MSPDPQDLASLRAELDTLRTERDALIFALERHEREHPQQTRLLIEEQDRFVSHLLESHERDLGRLRLELDEARTTADRLLLKQERDRTAAARLEEDHARTIVELGRACTERDAARAELRRAQHAFVTAEASVERLESELGLARAMLGDAMATNRVSGPAVSSASAGTPEAPRSTFRGRSSVAR